MGEQFTFASEERLSNALIGYSRKTIPVDADDLRAALSAISAARTAFNQLNCSLVALGDRHNDTFDAYRLAGLETHLRAARGRVERAYAMRATVPCHVCNGLGAALRDGKHGRVFEWPCPNECPPPLSPGIVRTHARGAVPLLPEEPPADG